MKPTYEELEGKCAALAAELRASKQSTTRQCSSQMIAMSSARQKFRR